MPNTDLRVLLVEDDDGCRELIATALEEDGFFVVEVAGAAAARDCLEEVRFDVVVADQVLGDGAGLELIQATRERYPCTEGVVVTGASALELDTGEVPLLRKPLELQPFLETVGRCALLGRRRWLLQRRSECAHRERNRLVEEVWRARADRLEARLADPHPTPVARALLRRRDRVQSVVRQLEAASEEER